MTTAPPLAPETVPSDDEHPHGAAVPASSTPPVDGGPVPGAEAGAEAGADGRPARPPRAGAPRNRAPRTRPAPAGRAPTVTRALGLSLTVLGGLLVVVLLYVLVFANITEFRAQETLFKSFRGELSQAIAPVGPAPVGAPVAVLTVPRIGLRAVVVEGTSSGQLLRGPGHRRDTPLPGQPGTSVVYGRGALAGHPFARLDHLQPGDPIVVTTGQSDHITFSVVGIRDSRDPAPAVTGATPRLTLVTTRGLTDDHTLIVSAVLTSTPLASGGARPAIGPEEKALGVDGSALLPVALWLQVLVLLTAAMTYLYLRGPRWTVYLLSTPVLLAVVWNIAENLMRMVPNVV